MQSAYRKSHSTETALLRVHNDISVSLDKGHVTALTLLDLSAAFDTIDHNTLTNRLAEWYGVSGMALAWFKSYLCGRHQRIKIDKSFSDSGLLEHGVPQGSVLGPLLFSLYTAPLSTIISSYWLSHHLYADDTQIYISLTGDTATESLKMLQSCITGVSAWMAQSKLKLNPSKTEFLLIGSKSQREKFINLFPLAEFRIQFKICTFVFRCLDDGQPSYLSSLLFSADSVKHLRSNNTNKLKVPRITTKFGARAFSVSGPTLWNLLPAHLRVAKNISSFRKLLKTHLFDLAFPP